MSGAPSPLLEQALVGVPVPASDGRPLQITVASTSPRVYRLHGLLSTTECEHVIRLAEPRMARSTVQAKDEVDDYRTSYTTFLSRHEDQVVRAIEERAAAITGIGNEYLEPLQVVRYEPGQQYKAHYDYFEPGVGTNDAALKKSGQRTITIFAYLSDLPSDTGGKTRFPRIPLAVSPTQGDALLWYNMLPDGSLDPRTYHAGEPPTAGTKYGMNFWFRERPW